MQRFPTLRKNSLSKQTQFLALSLLFAAPIAAQDPIESPEQTPERWLEEQIQQGRFGDLDLEHSRMDVEIFLEDDEGLRSEEVVLTRAGEPVNLHVEWQQPTAPANPGGMDDRGVFRQSGSFEVLWAAEPSDSLTGGSDGTMVWRSGKRDGTASWVTADVTVLQSSRTATAVASSEVRVPGVMASGQDGILIIPSVAFDRGGDGLLMGTNIGIYPSETASSAPNIVRDRAGLYRPPADFYRVDAKSSGAKLTENLTLGDLMPPVFDDEQSGTESVRYVAMSPRLLTFMRAFEAKIEDYGIKPRNLKILRSFVSPTDRRRLERRGVVLAEFTRYQYGDAVGLIIDPGGAKSAAPRMGDVNQDGTSNIEDIQVLADLAKDTMDELGIYGGVGVIARYEGPGPALGTPYLHVDLRGWFVPFREE